MAPISNSVAFKYGAAKFVAMPFSQWGSAKPSGKPISFHEIESFVKTFNQLHFGSKQLPEELGRCDIGQVYHNTMVEDRAEFNRFIVSCAAKFGYTRPQMLKLGPKETIMLVAMMVASHYSFHFPPEDIRTRRFNNRFLDIERVDCSTLATNLIHFFNWFRARNSALVNTLAYKYTSWYGGHTWNMLVSLKRSASRLEAHFTWIDMVAAMKLGMREIGSDKFAITLGASPVEGHDIRVVSRLPSHSRKGHILWTHHPFNNEQALAFFTDPSLFSEDKSVKDHAVNTVMKMMRNNERIDASTILTFLSMISHDGHQLSLGFTNVVREYYRLNKVQYTPEEKDLINRNIRTI